MWPLFSAWAFSLNRASTHLHLYFSHLTIESFTSCILLGSIGLSGSLNIAMRSNTFFNMKSGIRLMSFLSNTYISTYPESAMTLSKLFSW